MKKGKLSLRYTLRIFLAVFLSFAVIASSTPFTALAQEATPDKATPTQSEPANPENQAANDVQPVMDDQTTNENPAPAPAPKQDDVTATTAASAATETSVDEDASPDLEEEKTADKSDLAASEEQSQETTLQPEAEPSLEAESGVHVTYDSHAQNIGWTKPVSDGAVSGTSGRGLRLEAIHVNVTGIDAQVVAQAHVQNIGWMREVRNGQLCGTSGKGLRVEAIKLRLVGADAAKYDIQYRAHVQNIGWQGWVRNGAIGGTSGRGLRVEAIQIRLVRRHGVRVSYSAHVQNIGWQSEVDGDAIAGTTGRGLRVEALRIRTDNAEGLTGGIEYQTHVQNIGWQKRVADGALTGTQGRGLRMEALRIWLTGEIADSYNVWYRAHVQNVGWTSWALNGEDSGSTGMGYRMEAVQICILPKTAADPSNSGAATSATCVGIPVLTYAAYLQSSGWQGFVSAGSTAGATGQSRIIEALRMAIDARGFGGTVQYRSHMQDVGWQGWVSADGVSGLPGKGKRMEALQIRLQGNASRTFDVWYRVHVQNYGWMGWTSNGASAGTQSLGLRVEALQVRILPKGSSAPGNTNCPFTTHAKKPHMILVGDSRTCCMYDAMHGTDTNNLLATDSRGDIWSAKVGAGYSWMVSTGVPQIEDRINKNTAVVILLGINDELNSYNWNRYISYINSKANAWVKRGAAVYYSSITPVGMHTGIDSDGYNSNKGDISRWNAAMRAGLSPNVTYLDTFNAIINNYRTVDGLHYNNETSRRLYNYVRNNVC